MSQEKDQSAEFAKRKPGRPKGSKTKAHPIADLILPGTCPASSCQLTTEAAIVIPGCPTRYTYPHKHTPAEYNKLKLQKVRCPCGQVYWRQTAIYDTTQKLGLFWPQVK